MSVYLKMTSQGIINRISGVDFMPDSPPMASVMEYPSGVESAILDPAPAWYGPIYKIRSSASLCDILDPFDSLEVGILSPQGSSMRS